jgi:hypothetical protein
MAEPKHAVAVHRATPMGLSSDQPLESRHALNEALGDPPAVVSSGRSTDNVSAAANRAQAEGTQLNPSMIHRSRSGDPRAPSDNLMRHDAAALNWMRRADER